MLGNRSQSLNNISSRLDIFKGQLNIVEESRLDPIMLSKAHDLVSVEGNIAIRDNNKFYINSSGHLIQDKIRVKLK
jgi:Ni,Fe-hydrogenase I small subunit